MMPSIPRWKAELLEKRKASKVNKSYEVPEWKKELLKRLQEKARSMEEASQQAEEHIARVSDNIFRRQESKQTLPVSPRHKPVPSGFHVIHAENVVIIERDDPQPMLKTGADEESDPTEAADSELPVAGIVSRLKNKFGNPADVSPTEEAQLAPQFNNLIVGNNTTSHQVELENNGTTSQGKTLSSQGDKAESQGAIPSSQGERPSSQETRPASQETRPSSQGTRPESQETRPSSQGTRPSSQGTRPSSQGTRPSSQGTRPSSQGERPSSQGTRPSSQGERPSSQGTRPASQDAAARSRQTATASKAPPIPVRQTSSTNLFTPRPFVAQHSWNEGDVRNSATVGSRRTSNLQTESESPVSETQDDRLGSVRPQSNQTNNDRCDEQVSSPRVVASKSVVDDRRQPSPTFTGTKADDVTVDPLPSSSAHHLKLQQPVQESVISTDPVSPMTNENSANSMDHASDVSTSETSQPAQVAKESLPVAPQAAERKPSPNSRSPVPPSTPPPSTPPSTLPVSSIDDVISDDVTFSADIATTPAPSKKDDSPALEVCNKSAGSGKPESPSKLAATGDHGSSSAQTARGKHNPTSMKATKVNGFGGGGGKSFGGGGGRSFVIEPRKSAGGGGNSFVIDPRKFKRSSAAVKQTTTSTKPQKAQQTNAQQPSTPRPAKGKRKLGVEQIEVIGGYVRLERSCISSQPTNNHFTRVKGRVTFNFDVGATFEYPSEKSLLANEGFPAAQPFSLGSESKLGKFTPKYLLAMRANLEALDDDDRAVGGEGGVEKEDSGSEVDLHVKPTPADDADVFSGSASTDLLF